MRTLKPAAIYRETARTCWRLAGPLFKAAVVVFVPVGLFDALIEEFGPVHSATSSNLTIAAAIVAVLVGLVLALLGAVFFSGAVAVMLAHRDGPRPALSEVARHLSYGRLAAADVLFDIAFGVGFLALVFPAFLILGWFGLVAPVIELEHRGVRAAFARSRALVRGRFWRVLVVLAPITVVTELLVDGLGDLGHGALGHTFIGNVTAEVVGNIVAAPIYAVAAVLLTLELIALGPRSR